MSIEDEIDGPIPFAASTDGPAKFLRPQLKNHFGGVVFVFCVEHQ
jgi:hypothetical protein